MDLSSIFSNFGGNAWDNYWDVAKGLNGIYGGVMGMQNNNAINSQVQQGLSTNQAALQQQARALQSQIDTTRQQAQEQYNSARGNVDSQNAQLQTQIDQGTSNLAALSDPNSAYMRQAREAIERKDAAAGRGSQWGDRETQLAGMLADNVSKYSPGMNQAITQARNQIASNNSGLAQLYNTAMNPSIQTQQQQLQAIQAQIAQAQAVNGVGRQAQNAATNSFPSLINNIGGAIKGLGGLFGGGSSAGGGITGYYGTAGATPQFGNAWDGSGFMGNNSVPDVNFTPGSFDLGAGYNVSNPYDYTPSFGGGLSLNNGGGIDYSDWK